MSTNPYESPSADIPVTGVLSGRREDLEAVAKYQKGVIICILIYLIAVVSQFVIPPELRIFLAVGFLLLALTGTVFVFLLSMKVYSPVVGILMGILTLVPCVGLIVLLIVNGKATSIMKANGISVGLLGAKNI